MFISRRSLGLIVAAAGLLAGVACGGEAAPAPRDNAGAGTTTNNGAPVATPRPSSLPPAITSISEPTALGQEITVTARGRKDLVCDLAIRLSIGVNAQAEGLGQATADAEGVLTWKFTLNPPTPPGTTTAILNCGPASRDEETFRLLPVQ